MYAFLNLQYRMKRIDAEGLKRYVPKYLTADQYYAITGMVYA